MDVYIGTICAFGFNYAPINFAQCNGQILNISQYTALFSLLGTYYGGNGTSTFALPNLMGHVANCQGQQPGGTDYMMGMTGGTSTVTLTPSNLPPHTHSVSFALNCNNNAASGTSPNASAQWPGNSGQAVYNAANTGVTIATPTVTLANTGGTPVTPVSIVDPYLVMNYSICLNGIYPTRN